VLGWPFPVHIYDQNTAYLAASNILLPYNPDEVRKRPRKRLSDACRAHCIEGWEHIDKETISKTIGDGRWRELFSPQDVFDYCEEDVRMSVKLLRAQLRSNHGADVDHVLWWSNYSAKTIALIQARGMPIDMVLWNLVQENKATIIAALIKQFDPSYGSPYPIYTPEGEWSYERFERWLVYVGIHAWPRLESGQLDIDSDAFRLMYHAHPGIEGLHALRDSIGFIVKARLPIGRDGRNRPSLFPLRPVAVPNELLLRPIRLGERIRILSEADFVFLDAFILAAGGLRPQRLGLDAGADVGIIPCIVQVLRRHMAEKENIIRLGRER
jgi:hypothetical protein